MRQLQWLPLEKRRKLHTGVFIHNAINGKSSQHGIKMVEGLKPSHNYRTRHVEKKHLNSKFHTTKQLERSISLRTAKVWNEIPPALKAYGSANTMKNKWQGTLIDTLTDY